MRNRILDRIMFLKISIGKIKMQVVDLAFILCLFVLAFLIRWKLMPIESADYYGFLAKWMEEIRSCGGFASLDHQISNYTSPYMYIMCILSYVTRNDLYALKLVSVFFDYLAAIAVFLILYQITHQTRKSVIGMTIVLLSPTVILDSAYWCQCDVIYTSFILLALYQFWKGNSRRCFIFLGISFAFKLQTVFIFPFLVIMWLKRKTILLRDCIWIPVIYVLSIIPAWIAGRSFWELLTIYTEQSGYYPWGTLEYPNVYALLGEVMPDMRHAAEVCGAGTYMALILMGLLAYYIYTKNVNLTDRFMITLALLTVAVMVYSLPHMHDRYGFLIDLLAILYCVLNPRRIPITCGFMLVSVLTFMPYLIAVHIVPIQYLAIAQLGLIVYVGYDLYGQMQESLAVE